ncbi:MAG: hypothetical protein LBU48_05730 [Coriobacteriales bacterium]|jgi:hypothetical protein|nr:hypothetical protein [Coriobacteriales bacterium]
MDRILVFEHALKHGLTEDQILHAWRNAFETATINRIDGAIDQVAIGFDQNGRAIEMTARLKPFGLLIYHANTPPTPRTLKELGLTGRHKK